MRELLLVESGGFLGSTLRYLLGGLAHRLVQGTLFPVGTAAVNMIGCLAIGMLAGLAEYLGVMSAEMRVFLLIGLLGGFTTFSSFGYETFQLLRDGQDWLALTNLLVHVFLGIGGVWGGFALSRIVR